MTRLLALSMAFVGLLAVQVSADEPQKKQSSPDAAKLAGSYKIVGGEQAGKKIAPEELKEVSVKITDKVITTYDKDEKAVYAANYEVDTSKKPWRITMVATVAPEKGKGTASEGLIEVEGDTVRLIYALPGGKAPTGFKGDEKQQMFVLKKTK